MTSPIRQPALETIPPQECQRLLGINDLGRLAWSAGPELMVVPVNYIVDDLHRDGRIGWTVLAQVNVSLPAPVAATTR